MPRRKVAKLVMPPRRVLDLSSDEESSNEVVVEKRVGQNCPAAIRRRRNAARNRRNAAITRKRNLPHCREASYKRRQAQRNRVYRRNGESRVQNRRQKRKKNIPCSKRQPECKQNLLQCEQNLVCPGPLRRANRRRATQKRKLPRRKRAIPKCKWRAPIVKRKCLGEKEKKRSPSRRRQPCKRTVNGGLQTERKLVCPPRRLRPVARERQMPRIRCVTSKGKQEQNNRMQRVAQSGLRERGEESTTTRGYLKKPRCVSRFHQCGRKLISKGIVGKSNVQSYRRENQGSPSKTKRQTKRNTLDASNPNVPMTNENCSNLISLFTQFVHLYSDPSWPMHYQMHYANLVNNGSIETQRETSTEKQDVSTMTDSSLRLSTQTLSGIDLLRAELNAAESTQSSWGIDLVPDASLVANSRSSTFETRGGLRNESPPAYNIIYMPNEPRMDSNGLDIVAGGDGPHNFNEQHTLDLAGDEYLITFVNRQNEMGELATSENHMQLAFEEEVRPNEDTEGFGHNQFFS